MSRLKDSPNHLGTQFIGATFTQILTPNLLASVGYDLSIADGYQANPYRAVSAGADGIVAERVPSLRLRNAVAAEARWFEERSEVVLRAAYRLYFDDWGVVGHTPEVSLSRRLWKDSELRLRYRYYTQSAADFYQSIYDHDQEYVTDDVKLSPFVGHTFGVRLIQRLGFFERSRLHRLADSELSAVYERVIQRNRFGNADVFALGLVVPY
jgi:hypothetical protein